MQLRYLAGFFVLVLMATTISVSTAQSGEELFDQGTVHFEKSEYAEAIALWNQSMSMDPSLTANAYYNIGLAYAAVKDYEHALEAWNRTVELVPASGIAHNNKGTALAFLGRNQEAQEEYALAVQLEPDNAKFKADLAIHKQLLKEQTQTPISPVIAVLALTGVCFIFTRGRKQD